MAFLPAKTRTAELAQLGRAFDFLSSTREAGSSMLAPGFLCAWMNSEGAGLGLQIQRGLASQWFESTFCARIIFNKFEIRSKRAPRVRTRNSQPVNSRLRHQRSVVRWESNPRQQSSAPTAPNARRRQGEFFILQQPTRPINSVGSEPTPTK